jgi:hypothetical protein
MGHYETAHCTKKENVLIALLLITPSDTSQLKTSDIEIRGYSDDTYRHKPHVHVHVYPVADPKI